MEEKIYKIMRGAGALNIVLGVISLVVGIAAGVLLIISGGKLISGKIDIEFIASLVLHAHHRINLRLPLCVVVLELTHAITIGMLLTILFP